MAETRSQIVLDVGAALECAEAATWATNGLVARTLEADINGKEAATTLHHAYSAQFHVARVLEWSKEWAQAQELSLSDRPPSKLGDCLTWMQRARDHAEKLCLCFPASVEVRGKAPRIAEWAERWPKDYDEAKGLAEKSLEKIDDAINAIKDSSKM